MMNFDSNGDDMSMEDILASIRKYVAEDDSKSQNQEQPQMKVRKGNISKDSSDVVIHLSESQVANSSQNSSVDEEVDSYKSPEVYRETGDISVSVVNNDSPTNGSPFSKLANALKTYAHKEQRTSNTEENNSTTTLTVDKFLEAIATPIVEKWVAKNMEKFVADAVEKEIEKIKNGV